MNAVYYRFCYSNVVNANVWSVISTLISSGNADASGDDGDVCVRVRRHTSAFGSLEAVNESAKVGEAVV